MPASAFGLFQADFHDFSGVQEYDYQTYHKDSGEVIFKEKFTISKLAHKGDDFLVIKTKGQALGTAPERFDKETLTYYLIRDDRLNSYYHENQTLKENEPFLKLKMDFDWYKKKANYLLTEKQKHKQSSINLSPSTVLTHDLGIFFQNMILKGRLEEPFTVIFPNGRMLNLKARVAGREKIRTKAGEFDCQRIEMKPDFPLLSFFAPSVTFWLMSQPPYGYVRYEGPERGPGSATVVQELVKVNKL
jgi:hypothetical protein